MPQYNRRKKGRFNWERAVQGAVSGGLTGFSVGGPKGAAIGATSGGILGGMTGRNTDIDRAPYERAIDDFSKLRRRSARFTADEHSVQTGAAFDRRGLNTSELAGGVIAANRGRFMRDAETDIAKFSADVNLRIAEAERQAALAEDATTRQGWLDLAGQLGLMAISGEFTPSAELNQGMLASLKQTHPKDVKRWIRGQMTDEELVGIYTRYAKLYGEPGTMQRRFSDLEMNVHGGQGMLPAADLPAAAAETYPSIQTSRASQVSGGLPADSAGFLSESEQARRETVPTSPDGTQGEPVNIEGKPIVPVEPGDSEVVKQAKEVLGKEEYEALKVIEPDFESLITGDEPTKVAPSPTMTWEAERNARTETPTETLAADEPLWHPDFLAQQSQARLLQMLEAMETEINNPNQSEAFRRRAQTQANLIRQELENRMWPEGEPEVPAAPDATVPRFRRRSVHGDVYGESREDVERAEIEVAPIPPTEIPGLDAKAAAADAEARRRREGMGASQRRPLIPRNPSPALPETELPKIDTPPAERNGKPNPIPTDTSMGRFRQMERDDKRAESYVDKLMAEGITATDAILQRALKDGMDVDAILKHLQLRGGRPTDTSVGRFRTGRMYGTPPPEGYMSIGMAPPPPPDLEDVPVETTPPKQEKSQISDTSVGRKRAMGMDATTPDNPLLKEAYKMLGKMELKDKTALMKYFDAANLKYFGESIDPTIVAWCAVYLDAVLKNAGYTSLKTGTYRAKEYMNYGTEGTGAVGDIAVWENHVGIVVEVGDGVVKILGGNQKDGVTIVDKKYLDNATNFLGYRKPVKADAGSSRKRSRFTGME